MRVGEPAWGDRGARRVLSLQLGTGGALAPRGPILCCVHTLELARIELHRGWGGRGLKKQGGGLCKGGGRGGVSGWAGKAAGSSGRRSPPATWD